MGKIDELKGELVLANRILLAHGVVDAFGHVSARHPDRPDRYFMSRRIAPGLVRAEDILEFDLESSDVAATGQPVYMERFIHGAIYAARTNVDGVVHSHSPGIVSFGITGARLRPVCHTCAFLGTGAGLFEIRDEFGAGTDLMIDSKARAQALARSLGDSTVVLMRGHGSTTVGPNVRRAVYRAIYAETNARLQREAMAMGTVNFMTAEEAASAEKLGEPQVERTWDFWKSEVDAA